MTDLFTRAKLRSIEKQKRRMKRERRENKLETFDLDMKTHNERMHKQVRQQRIKELIETIKALQMIGSDCSQRKQELDKLFRE